MNPPRRVAIYARVSTDDQTTDNQIRELRATAERHDWTVVREFVDHGVSGVKGRDQRPQYDALLKGVARKEFDLVAAWSVDRLGRSLQDLVGFMQELKDKGVHLFLHQQALDTTTASGRMVFGMCSVFAEFERAMIQERVKAGLERARANGVRLGRKPTKPKVEAQIRALLSGGAGKKKIARTLGVGVSVVQRLAIERPVGTP